MKLVFYLGFLFFGGGFLIAFFQYFAYNGFCNVFEYAKPEHLNTYVKIDSIEKTNTIFYKYWIDEKEYRSKQSIYIDKIQKYDFYESNVYYNKQIPSLSYVGNKELKLRSPISGMIIFGITFLFFFLMYKFADMDKWIGIYTRGEYKSSNKRQ